MDGISVLETNKDEQPFIESDILYNKAFEEDAQCFGPDDGFIYPSMEECFVNYTDVIDGLGHLAELSSPSVAKT